MDDDPAPALAIGDASVTEGNAGTVGVDFTVTLTGSTAQTVTVNYATADGTATAGGGFGGNDYQAAGGTLTFTSGQTTKTVTVSVKGDKKLEANEWFAVNLSGASGNALVSDSQGIGWILNDDH